MKKITLLFIVAMLNCFWLCSAASAVDATLPFSKQYNRTKGKPNVYTDTFNAVPGEALHVVENGSEEEASTWISNAGFWLNGLKLFKHYNFSKKVRKQEVKVELAATNTLKVVLKGKPERFLAITLENNNGIPSLDFKKYVRTRKGGKNAYKDIFSATPGEAVLLVENGNGEDPKTVLHSAEIWLNGVKLFRNHDFSKKIKRLEVKVNLTATNTLKVVLKGKPGSFLTIKLESGTAPPPAVSLSADPAAIALGGSSQLTWSSTNADSVSIMPDIGTVSASGTTSVSPSATTTYTITATGPGGTATDTAAGAGGTVTESVTVTVLPLPSVSLSVDPLSIIAGDSSQLIWSSTNADSVSIDNGIGEVAANGSASVAPTATTTYTITATGAGGMVSESVTVTVFPLPTVALSADPASIPAGDNSTLSWSSTNADNVSIDNGIGTVDLNGSVSVAPTATTTYTITATGAGGIVSESVTVTVLPLPTASLSADPVSIPVGDSSTLSWSSTNADSVTIDNGIETVDLNGSASVAPTATTTYTITAAGAGGTVSETVTVTVVQPPTVSLSAAPVAITLGGSSQLSWSSTNANSVSITPDIGTVSSSGTATVSPSATTTYTITAAGAGGTVTESVTVTVIQPPAVSLSAAPVTITLGGSSQLSWSSTNANSVNITPDIGPVSSSGTATVSPSATTTYTITATGPGGTATDTATVEVLIPAPTVTISADPATVVAGASVVLSWQSTNADTVSIDNGIGAVAVNGSVSAAPTATTTYTVTAAGTGGTVSESVTVTVLPLPSVSLSVDPLSIIAGDSSQLTWSSMNADTVSITPDIGTIAASGTRSVSPSVTTTYTITATGPGGTASDTAMVEVSIPALMVLISAESETIALGTSTLLSWQSNGVDTIHIDNGIGTVAADDSL